MLDDPLRINGPAVVGDPASGYWRTYGAKIESNSARASSLVNRRNVPSMTRADGTPAIVWFWI